MDSKAILLAGGSVVDGLGSPVQSADVLIVGGRIVAVDHAGNGSEIAPAGTTVVDVRGRVVAPGFVDIHTHSDLTVLSGPRAASKLRQGVTTEVVGNCGLGAAPLLPGVDRDAVRASIGYLDLDPEVHFGWDSFADYLAALGHARPAINLASFVAHLPIHAGVVGFGADRATPAQRNAMATAVDEALSSGAVGLSTGLVYAPLCFADEDELTALAEVVAARDRLFAWHAKDYGDHLIESVEQTLRVARRTGVRTQISHLVCVGKRNHHKVIHALDLVSRARAEGVDVAVDLYPYLAGNAPLAQILPEWAQAGGADAMCQHLADPSTRERVAAQWQDLPLGWEEYVINDAPDRAICGQTVSQIAADRGVDGTTAALDLLQAYGGAVMMVAYGRSEQNLRDVLAHPAGVVASDGQALTPDGPTGTGSPHPRSYGCFPRYLSRYAGADLSDAIRRCTSAPAERVGLDRGRLVPGAVADVVVFDPAALSDTATFDEPHQFATGIQAVYVGGTPVLLDGRDTGASNGHVLTPTEQGVPA